MVAQVPIFTTGRNIVHLQFRGCVLTVYYCPKLTRNQLQTVHARNSTEALRLEWSVEILVVETGQRTWYGSSEHCSSSSNWQEAPPRAATIPDSHWLSFTELMQHCFCAILTHTHHNIYKWTKKTDMHENKKSTDVTFTRKISVWPFPSVIKTRVHTTGMQLRML